MVTILVGKDHMARGNALQKKRDQLTSQGYDVITLSANEHEMNHIISSITHQSLFQDASAYIVYDGLQDPNMVAVLSSVCVPLVCVEESLDAKQRASIKKNTTQDMVIEKFLIKSSRDNRVFKLTDYIVQRDTKNAWLTYRWLIDQGITTHQMVGVIWWQVKNILLVARGQGLVLKPNVANSARRAMAKYDAPARDQLAYSVLDLYHRGHRGENLDNLLEEFLLSLHQ